MWNPFAKKTIASDDAQSSDDKKVLTPKEEKKEAKAKMAEQPKMGMMQRLAMKKFESMSSQEQQKLVQKFMTPENIQKHKKEILEQMEQMKKAGFMNQAQYNEARKRMGI